jgi:hypothetical protein
MHNDHTEGPGARPSEDRPSSGKTKHDSPWVLILVGLILLGLAGRGAYWVIGDFWQGIASLRWPKTQGVVVETWLERSTSRGGTQNSLKVVYRYAIAGKEYENNRISFPETRDAGDEAHYRRLLNEAEAAACE